MGIDKLQKEPGTGGTIGPNRGRDPEQVKSWVGNMNRTQTYPLTHAQRAALDYGGTACWIYNISPIFAWRRSYQNLGEFLIQPRERAKRISTAIPIARAYQMSYDKGDRRRQPYVEYGEDIAESLLGCSKEYPLDLVRPTNNLVNWGCFITYGHPLEELDLAEQEKLLHEASVVHDVRCREIVLQGDQLFNAHPTWLCETHRLAALEVNEMRPWVTQRSTKDTQPKKECPFCGHENKSSAVKCAGASCGEILDYAKYKELQDKLKAEADKPEKKK